MRSSRCARRGGRARASPRWLAVLAALATWTLSAAADAAEPAAPPSIEAFAARPPLEDVAISPNGRYLALVESLQGRAAAVVIDRERRELPPKVVIGEPEHFRFVWCRFASDQRLLCSLRAMAEGYGVVYAISRLVAVDVDGSHQRVLMQNNDEVQGQYQDRIINWNPGKPNTVLIEADEGLSPAQLATGVRVIGNVGTHGLPAVFELDVVSGRVSLRERARAPIRHWITDGNGVVRLGSGLAGAEVSYYARLAGDREWRRLEKFEAFTRGEHFRPIAISSEDPNKAYASAGYQGRDAIWLMDLTDREPPTLVYANPTVDVRDPLLSQSGKLLAILYETERPSLYCVAVRVCSVLDSLGKLVPDKFSVVTDFTRDGNTLLVRSFSDREPVAFSLVDAERGVSTRLTAARPAIDPATLAPLKPITYPARDGTPIPGYVTLPLDVPPERLPLIVMPHGGPIARDGWSYFFLRNFLASRGYAVLQMNFRGSAGYGSDWFFAAHQDWGGLTYDDVVDGARWAVAQGIADPARVCVVGWSFGGYLAEVAAQRNPDLFRCAVSIAGISDLSLFLDEGHQWLNSALQARQVGTDPVKLKRDSPRQHAAEVTVPLLLLHGDRDAQVPYQQSVAMDAALTKAGRAHRFVSLPAADHQLSEVADRVTLLREVEGFLATHIGPTAR